MGAKKVVNGLDFHVEHGEVFGLLGPNGAGKTTTIKMIVADQRPTSGEILLKGKPILNSQSDALLSLGFCPQHDALWGDLTIRDHLECFAKVPS
jgi:ATP-binding cassette subfamily A (ABC1) protein 5